MARTDTFATHYPDYVPSQATSPPEPDDATYERNLRNGLRTEIMGAIDLIDDRLGELDRGGFGDALHELAKLRDSLVREMEG